jgi:hypothetical protein
MLLFFSHLPRTEPREWIMAQIFRSKAVWLSVFFMMTSQAGALQLTNRDTADHKLVVTEKDTEQELVVKPSEILDDICTKGCTIKMSDGEEYEFEGNEVVSIEEGLLFLDEPSDGVSSDTDIGEPADSAEDGAAKKE